MRQFALVLFLLVLGWISPLAEAANESLIKGESKEPVEKILQGLERKHSINIFYRSQWFKDVLIDAAIINRPIDEAIEVIAGEAGLEAVLVDDNIVFVSDEGHTPPDHVSDETHKVIGDPAQLGRYTNATISGRIKDASTGEALIGAVVFEPESERGATTDVNGKFQMNLPVGSHELRFSYIGYEERYQEIQLISDGSIQMELFSETTQLDEVTIVASRAEDNIMRTQMSMISMDSKSLTELPTSFGEQDIVRSMTLLPGVQSVGEFGTGFNVRGGSADQNLILLESVPLFNASHLFGLISVINPDMVSGVTLMKAGIPARYGERASSVMDIRLSNREAKEETTLTGGLGLINSRVLLETPVAGDRANFSFGVRSSYSDWLLQRIPNEELMNSTAGFYDLTALSTITINPRNHLTLFGYHSFDRFGFMEENLFQYSNSLASVRWNRVVNDNLSSTMVLGWSNYRNRTDETPEINPLNHSRVSSELDYKSFRYQFSYQPLPNHNIEFGINAISYSIDPGDLKPIGEESTVSPKNLDNEQALELAGFVSDEIGIGERISLELGLRFTQYLELGPARVDIYEENQPLVPENVVEEKVYEKNEIVSRYNGLEPRFGLRYKTGESSSVKISYNRINQYISLLSNTSVMSPSDLWKLSDTHLKPLKSDQYALGFFRNFSDNTIETSLELYYRDFQNIAEYQSGAEIAMNERLETDVINAKGYAYGLEFFLRKNTGRLTGWTSYTYSSSMRRSQEAFPENQINRNEYFPSNYDRPHNLVVNMGYEISRRWRFGATFNYSTGRPVTLPERGYSFGNNYLVHFSDRNKYRLPDYHRLDISITLGENLRKDQRGKGSWTFSLMNVYGRKNPYSVFYKREPQSAGSGRSFNLYNLYIIGRPLPTITYNFSF